MEPESLGYGPFPSDKTGARTTAKLKIITRRQLDLVQEKERLSGWHKLDGSGERHVSTEGGWFYLLDKILLMTCSFGEEHT